MQSENVRFASLTDFLQKACIMKLRTRSSPRVIGRWDILALFNGFLCCLSGGKYGRKGKKATSSWSLRRLARDDPQGLRGGSALLSSMWWPDENHLFYRRAEDHRQDHRPSRAHLWSWMASSASDCPTRAPDGSRGERGVFLRASVAVFCWFEGGVYLKLDGLEVSADLFLFLSRWPCRFGRDNLISRCQWVEITENCDGFGVRPKRKFSNNAYI